MRTKYSVLHYGVPIVLVDSLREAAEEIHKRAKLTLESVLSEIKKMKKSDEIIPLARDYALGRTTIPVPLKSKQKVHIIRIDIDKTKYDDPSNVGKIIYFPKGLRARMVVDSYSTILFITKQSIAIISREFPQLNWSEVETYRADSKIVDDLITRASWISDSLSRYGLMENPDKDNPLITWGIQQAISCMINKDRESFRNM